MSSIKMTIWVLQIGALVFGMLFFFFAFKAGHAGETKNKVEYAAALDSMSKSAMAFLAFILTYLVTAVLSVLMGIR